MCAVEVSRKEVEIPRKPPAPSHRRAEAGLPGFWHVGVMHVVRDKRIARERDADATNLSRYTFSTNFVNSARRRAASASFPCMTAYSSNASSRLISSIVSSLCGIAICTTFYSVTLTVSQGADPVEALTHHCVLRICFYDLALTLL